MRVDQNEKNFTQEMWLFMQQGSTKEFDFCNEQGGIGMLARILMGDDWGVRHASLCCYKSAE